MFDNKQFKDRYIGTDWKITSVDENYVNLIDNKKNKYFISQNIFLKFIFKNKITISENAFSFNVVIDNKNNMCTDQEYYTWLNTMQQNQSINIKYDDLKVGFVYQLDTKEDYFIYLGKKWIIKWKFNNKTRKIELSKPKQEHLCITTYKHDKLKISQIYNKLKFSLSKQKIIKEIGEYNSNGHTIEKFVENLKVSSDYLYFDEAKPKNDLDLMFKEVDMNYLKNIFEISGSSFINLFHKSGNFYIKNNYGIYKEATDNKNDKFQRQISKSNCNEVIFSEPFENELECFNETNSYSSWKTKLYELTENCDNDHYRIAPENYFILVLK